MRPNHAANLKPWAAPRPTHTLRVIGEPVDDEVAVGGERVQAGRRARCAEALAEQGLHELGEPVLHRRVGIEGAGVGVDVGAAAVL